ncbi:MAG: hypothetical protein JWR80_5463 [Bradyrhizobium sp.]|nr:hypothetical protein [Bradyrhizobium sp.]
MAHNAHRKPAAIAEKLTSEAVDNASARIDLSIAHAMRRQLPVQTPQYVMDRFGISVNTWVKIRDGIPIRRSVATRLLERLRREGLVD